MIDLSATSPAQAGAVPRAPSLRSDDRLVWLGLRAWALVGIAVMAWLSTRLLQPIRPLLLPVFVAAVLVYAVHPLVSRIERHGIRRGLAVTAAFVPLACGFGIALVALLPLLVHQLTSVIQALPTSVQQVEQQAQRLAGLVGLNLDVTLDADAARAWLQEQQNRDAAVQALTGLGAATLSAVRVLLLLLLGPVLAFYVLVDLPRLQRVLPSFLPRRHRARIVEMFGECSAVVGGYLRGQLLVATFVGITSALALSAIGLRYWLVVGVVAGVTNLIPFLGPIVGGALAVTVALASGDPRQALWAAVVILVVQQVESHVVAPLVLGGVTRLPPLVVLIAVLLGGFTAGVPGMLLTVPVAGSIGVLLRHLRGAADDSGVGAHTVGSDGQVPQSVEGSA